MPDLKFLPARNSYGPAAPIQSNATYGILSPNSIVTNPSILFISGGSFCFASFLSRILSFDLKISRKPEYVPMKTEKKQIFCVRNNHQNENIWIPENDKRTREKNGFSSEKCATKDIS